MFVKIAQSSAPTHLVLAHRFSVAFVIACIPVLLKRVRIKITFDDLKSIAPLALFYPVLFFLLQALGLMTTDSSFGGIINSLVPIFTIVLAAFFLKEKSTALQMFFVVISVGGVIFITVMNGVGASRFDFVGTLLLTLSSLAFACHNILARIKVRNYPAFTLTFVMVTSGCVAFNISAVITCVGSGTISEYFKPFLSGGFIVAILYLGFLGSVGTSFLSNFALSQIEASKMSVFSNLTVVVSMVAGAIILSEPVNWYHILGAVVIIVGVIGANLSKRKAQIPGNLNKTCSDALSKGQE